MLRFMLSRAGFDVEVAQDALAGLRAAYRMHPDVILLDILMPNIDGFEACRRLREVTDVPIIFVTAIGTIESVVRGLSLGADDYITKPFNHLELVSRITACLRREQEQSDRGGNILLPAQSVMLDCDRRELVIGDRTVYLTPREFEVLRLLMRNAGKVIGTDAISVQVWGQERIGDPSLVKQYIYRLRQKIEQDPHSPRYLLTDRGWGYYFYADDLR